MSNYFKLMSIGILSVSTLPSLSLKYIVPIILPLFILTSGLSFNCRSLNSIPTLIVFKEGKEIERVSGAMDAESLDKFVERFL